MAYYNSAKKHLEEKERQAYEDLKESLTIGSEYFFAKGEMERMENKLKEQQEELKEYQSFFNKLSSFLPKQHSIHDRLI